MTNFPSNYEGLGNRLRYIIESRIPAKGRYNWLEEHTGIPRGTWQTLFRRPSSTPGGEVIQAVARLYPRYAFWLASGLTDQAYGHRMPRHPGSKCFPEHDFHEDQKRFDDYFSHCMAMQMKVYDASTPQGNLDEQKEMYERLISLAHLRKAEIEMLHAEEERKAAAREESWEKRQKSEP